MRRRRKKWRNSVVGGGELLLQVIQIKVVFFLMIATSQRLPSAQCPIGHVALQLSTCPRPLSTVSFLSRFKNKVQTEKKKNGKWLATHFNCIACSA